MWLSVAGMCMCVCVYVTVMMWSVGTLWVTAQHWRAMPPGMKRNRLLPMIPGGFIALYMASFVAFRDLPQSLMEKAQSEYKQRMKRAEDLRSEREGEAKLTTTSNAAAEAVDRLFRVDPPSPSK